MSPARNIKVRTQIAAISQRICEIGKLNLLVALLCASFIVSAGRGNMISGVNILSQKYLVCGFVNDQLLGFKDTYRIESSIPLVEEIGWDYYQACAHSSAELLSVFVHSGAVDGTPQVGPSQVFRTVL